MPPKRKRGDDTAAETTTRTTRASSRTTKKISEQSETLPDAKKPRKTTSKTAKPSTKSRGKAAAPAPQQGSGEIRPDDSNIQETSKASGSEAVSVASSNPQPYSAAHAGSLFDAYADSDQPTVIGPEGFERLCSDMDISMEGALPLILAWQMSSSEMAKISKVEWEKNTTELQISDLSSLSTALREIENLVLWGKLPVEPAAAANRKSSSSTAAEPYNRTRYYKYAKDTKRAFNELYTFCFALAKPPQARNIDMETASAFWSVLLAPCYPLMSDLLQFINEKGTYKGVNKDLWNMTLEFCRTIDTNLSNYDADGAWPTMLDDYAAWKGAKKADQESPADATEA